MIMRDGVRFWLYFAISMLLIAADIVLLMATSLPMWAFWVILAASMLLLFVPQVRLNGPKAEVSDGYLFIRAFFMNLNIRLDSITGVECRQTFDPGVRVIGYGGINTGSGRFSNQEFGPYYFAGDTTIPLFVIVRYGDRTVVFNDTDADTTFRVFSQIKENTDCGAVGTVNVKRRICHRNVMLMGTVLGIAVMIAVVVLALFAGHANAYMDDDGVRVDATMMSFETTYENITDAELRYGMDYGIRTWGYGGSDVLSGNFRNDEFGSYRLAVNKTSGYCIVLHLAYGGVMVFNQHDDTSTQAFFDDLTQRLSATS